MSLDVYRKIAIGAMAQVENHTPVVFALASSYAGADCRQAAEALASAFASVAGDAAAVSPGKVETTAAADEAVRGMREAHAVTVVPLPCLREDTAAMLLAAAAGNVLLLERRGRSRTDEISAVLEVIQNLGARPVGFLME